jgi:glutamine amidotransferase-like uncharacterized protein
LREVKFFNHSLVEFLDPQRIRVVETSILKEEWMKRKLLLLTLGFAVLPYSSSLFVALASS